MLETDGSTVAAGRPALSFREIDVEADQRILTGFARDLFATSFDDPAWFDRRFGADGSGYVRWLLEATGQVPEFALFAVREGEAVGMVALGIERRRPSIGHVYHYYLRADARGLGLGEAMNEHALGIFSKRGLMAASLNVTPGNLRAVRFYEKLGWRPTGTVGDHGVVEMETPVPAKPAT